MQILSIVLRSLKSESDQARRQLKVVERYTKEKGGLMDLGQHPAPSGLPGVRPFLSDQLAMPPPQGVWGRDGGHLPQHRAADPVGTGRHATAIVVRQTESAGPELTS